MNVPLAMLAVLAITATASSVHAACGPTRVHVRSTTELDDMKVRTDYTAENLVELAGDVTQNPPHPILGFYASSTGYRFQVSPVDVRGCEELRIKVQLVATRRVIELAKELLDSPCMFTAALKHYKYHAALQSEALGESGLRLQSALQTFILDQEAGSRPNNRMANLQADANRFVEQWLGDFQKTLPALRKAADTPAEIQALAEACKV